MVIAFFELRLIGLTRFPLWLTPYLKEKSSDLKIVLFYEEDDIKDTGSVLSKYPVGTTLIKVNNVNRNHISELLLTNGVDKLVVMAQRIPDTCFVATAKSLGIQTIMYQHGLYVPFMKREGSLFIKNILKTYRFIKYALTTADVICLSRLKILISYFRIYILGLTPVKSGLPMSAINVDKVMVYGNHWKKYHLEQYGYAEANQVIVGTPDFDDLPDLLLHDDNVSFDICYIAQTLVEDGRLPRGLMETFISNLALYIVQSGRKIFIRLHPRSDISIYEPLSGLAEFSKSDFPKSVVYLGHYSSIIAKSTFFSDKIILVDFPEHKIPEYIQMLEYCNVLFSDFNKLSSSIDSALQEGVFIEKVKCNIIRQDEFFDSRVKRPFNDAAECILHKN